MVTLNKLPPEGTAIIENVIENMVTDARAGDYSSSVMAAMLIHLWPKEARATGLASEYSFLLSQSLQSNDPELLACLSEELMIGIRLSADAKMAYRASTKADEISGFMGAYVVGRTASNVKPDFAIKNLRKARSNGHIPAMVLEHRLIVKRLPLIAPFASAWFKVIEFYHGVYAISRKDKRRLWRGLDVFGHKKYFLDLIGPDRQYPFQKIDNLMPDNKESTLTAHD